MIMITNVKWVLATEFVTHAQLLKHISDFPAFPSSHLFTLSLSHSQSRNHYHQIIRASKSQNHNAMSPSPHENVILFDAQTIRIISTYRQTTLYVLTTYVNAQISFLKRILGLLNPSGPVELPVLPRLQYKYKEVVIIKLWNNIQHLIQYNFSARDYNNSFMG